MSESDDETRDAKRVVGRPLRKYEVVGHEDRQMLVVLVCEPSRMHIIQRQIIGLTNPKTALPLLTPTTELTSVRLFLYMIKPNL